MFRNMDGCKGKFTSQVFLGSHIVFFADVFLEDLVDCMKVPEAGDGCRRKLTSQLIFGNHIVYCGSFSLRGIWTGCPSSSTRCVRFGGL